MKVTYTNPLVNGTSNFEVLYTYFHVYGLHEAGVKICKHAIAGNETAKKWAKKVWEIDAPNAKGNWRLDLV